MLFQARGLKFEIWCCLFPDYNPSNGYTCPWLKQQYPLQPPLRLPSHAPQWFQLISLPEPGPENINPGDKSPITARSRTPFRLYD